MTSPPPAQTHTHAHAHIHTHKHKHKDTLADKHTENSTWQTRPDHLVFTLMLLFAGSIHHVHVSSGFKYILIWKQISESLRHERNDESLVCEDHWCVKITWTHVMHTCNAHTHPWNSPPTIGLGCLSMGPFPATGVFSLCSRSCLRCSLCFFLLPDLSDCSHLVLVIRMSLQELPHSAGMWLQQTSIWLLPLSPLLVGIPKVSLAWCAE